MRILNWLNDKLSRDRTAAPAQRSHATLGQALRDEGLHIDALLRDERRFYSSLGGESLLLLNRVLPQEVKAHIEQAEKILRHEFNLLGSGDYVPVDPERRAAGGYRPIDWYLDPVRNLRFPRGIPVKEWDLYAMRPSNADIKYPWELARCQHWPALAQAWLLSGDERFAEEIHRELDDFRESNPVGVGVNWTCTMDVAIRALNWMLALDMTAAAPAGEGVRERALEALFEHGAFIFANLENHYEVTSNHFLSNVVGLYYLAFRFEKLPQGRQWLEFCRDALEKEIVLQVLEDGADYESSVPYHRLVTELFLGAARLSRHFGVPLSAQFDARLEKMVEFLAGVLRPDGLMPQVGDADDGRLHILSRYGRWQPQDPRHLFGPAARYFDRPEWLDLGAAEGAWEAMWWGYAFDERVLRECAAGSGLPRDNFHLYPQAGLAVAREGGNYLLVTNGIVGTKGFGNHKHNDQLGFEYFHGGVPLFVDPGSYVYTSDFAARNRFRSTKAHNTLCIDDTEQNEMNEEWIFRLFETAHAEHLRFSATELAFEYAGCHIGYKRLHQEIRHERAYRLNRKIGELKIVDDINGSGECALRWQFLCAPGVRARKGKENTVNLHADGKRLEMEIPKVESVHIEDSWYSPSYGKLTRCVSIVLEMKAQLESKQQWSFVIRNADGQ